jgi:hypothetical protein
VKEFKLLLIRKLPPTRMKYLTSLSNKKLTKKQ